MHRVIVLPALLGLFIAGGCQEVPAEPDVGPTQRELEACDASCAAQQACGEDVDPVCADRCSRELVNLRHGISRECSAAYLDFQECDAELSCADQHRYPNECWEALHDAAEEACAFEFCPEYCAVRAECDPELYPGQCESLCNGGALLVAADAPDCLDDVFAAYACLNETACGDHGDDGPCGDLLAAIEDCKVSITVEQED